MIKCKPRVPGGAKIFTMTGSYADVRAGLLRRGWSGRPCRPPRHPYTCRP